jgi:Zn-dependent protease
MRWRPTIYLGRWSGVEVRLDVLVVLLIGLLFFYSLNDATVANAPAREVWSAVAHLALLCAMMLCMFAHEIGHALMCKLRGHQPILILLSFVGLTFFKTTKVKPNDEFWIAIAGPMVNLGIALATAPFIAVALAQPGGPPLFTQAGMATFTGFMAWLSTLNFAVAAINLMPGWPADGARAMRGWLAKKWGYGAATVRAVAISHGFWLILAGLSVIVMTGAPALKWFAGSVPSRSPASLIVMYNVLFLVFATMGLYYGWAEKRRVARLGAEKAAEVVGPPPEFMPGKRKQEEKLEPQATARGPEEQGSTDTGDTLATKTKEAVDAGKAMWAVARATGKGAGWFARQGTRVIGAMLQNEKPGPKGPGGESSSQTSE